MIAVAISLIVSTFSLFYAYQVHVQWMEIDRERRNRNHAEILYLIRENEGLRLQPILMQKRNEDLEHRVVEMEAGAIASRSVMAEQAQELVQLRAVLKSMVAECESKNTALTAQSREIAHLRGDLAASESRCRWKDQEVQKMRKEREASNAACDGYELQVLELNDKLSEYHSRLARRSRTNIWVMDGVPTYESTGRKRKPPTRKRSRPATDPNKSNNLNEPSCA